MHLHVLSWPTVLPVHRCFVHPSIGCLFNSTYPTNLEHWFTNLSMALHHCAYPDSSLHTHHHASSDHLIKVFCPFRAACRHTVFESRGFSACGPPLWNSLPHSLRYSETYPAFCFHFKTHLFQFHELSP